MIMYFFFSLKCCRLFLICRKKERISHCRSVTDAICLPSVQGLSDFHKILESVVEVLFQLSSDPDSDIRSVAGECLNRLVRV